MFALGLLSPGFFLSMLVRKMPGGAKISYLFHCLSFLLAILIVGILLVLVLPDFSVYSLHGNLSPLFLWLWATFLIARCNHIFYGRLLDALVHIKPIRNKSSKIRHSTYFPWLKNFLSKWLSSAASETTEIHRKLTMTLRNYVELVLNFSLLYLMFPASFWKNNNPPKNIAESIYYSSVTVTTLGYGDISPTHWLPQFLVVFEVFSGFVLVFVCFSIYMQEKARKK